MAKKPAAAVLDYRATFKGLVFTNGTDADGQPISGHADEFTVWCGIQWKRGRGGSQASGGRRLTVGCST